jgi:hypothetical protein
LEGMVRGPIAAGATEIISLSPWGFPRGGGSAKFPDDSEFNFGSLVYESGRFVFKNCTNVTAQTGSAIAVRHPWRGDEPYWVKSATWQFPIEEPGHPGRCERFDTEVLSALDIGEGQKGDSYIHVGISYDGVPGPGSQEEPATGGQ